jgi:hypothetical protein
VRSGGGGWWDGFFSPFEYGGGLDGIFFPFVFFVLGWGNMGGEGHFSFLNFFGSVGRVRGKATCAIITLDIP